LPSAFTQFNEPVTVLVVSAISHPINTEIEANLLGAAQRAEESPLLLVTPTADNYAPQHLGDIPEEQRAEFIRILKNSRSGEWRWLILEDVEPFLHTAAMRYRQKQAEGKLPHLDPAWQPIHIGRPTSSFIETERYTPAEYTFYELPYRFQYYVSEYLAPDERILYAARRPAMLSQRKRSWLRRKQLQAGVLILTNQRLIQLAELVPPDSANIRYGFHTMVGALERLAEVTLTSPDSNLLLQTRWRAAGGEIAIEWESPDHTRAALDELVAFLSGFQPNVDACALRRAALPTQPEKLSQLTDTAAHDPEELIPINEQFSISLAESLTSSEQAYAWALLPKWFQHRKNHQALVVTERRIFMLPNHSIDIPLARVATLEYTSSILESSLGVNYFERGKLQKMEILFPYPAQDSFRTCFEAARRCMAVLPL